MTTLFERDEESVLRFDFFAADTIRKRIMIQRHAREMGYKSLADEMLKQLVPTKEDSPN